MCTDHTFSTGLSQERSSTWKPIAASLDCRVAIDASSEASLPGMKCSVACMGDNGGRGTDRIRDASSEAGRKQGIEAQWGHKFNPGWVRIPPPPAVGGWLPVPAALADGAGGRGCAAWRRNRDRPPL